MRRADATWDGVRNNDELYARKDVDAEDGPNLERFSARVARTVEAVNAGRDAYVEKPTADTGVGDYRVVASFLPQPGEDRYDRPGGNATPQHAELYQKAAE